MSDEFTINFGDVKPMALPPEGNYELVISDYELKQAKNPDSRVKGYNVALIFQFADPEFSNYKVYHNLWVSRDNAWAAKLFFEALTGKNLDDEFNPNQPDVFIGETIGATLIHEDYVSKTGATKTKLSIATPDAWYTV